MSKSYFDYVVLHVLTNNFCINVFKNHCEQNILVKKVRGVLRDLKKFYMFYLILGAPTSEGTVLAL